MVGEDAFNQVGGGSVERSVFVNKKGKKESIHSGMAIFSFALHIFCFNAIFQTENVWGEGKALRPK